MPVAVTLTFATLALLLAVAVGTVLKRHPNPARYRRFVAVGSSAGWRRSIALLLVFLAVGAMGTIGAKTEFPGPFFTKLIIIGYLFVMFCDALMAFAFNERGSEKRALLLLLYVICLFLGLVI